MFDPFCCIQIRHFKIMNISVLCGVFVLVLGICQVVSSLKFEDCGSVEGKVTSVVVEGCTTEPCKLKKGTDVSFEVDFTVNEDVTKATAVVHGIISSVPVPFPIPHPNACEDSGLACPLKKGSSQKYKQSIEVKTEYPAWELIVKWELKDQSSKDIFCIELPVEIVA